MHLVATISDYAEVNVSIEGVILKAHQWLKRDKDHS